MVECEHKERKFCFGHKNKSYFERTDKKTVKIGNETSEVEVKIGFHENYEPDFCPNYENCKMLSGELRFPKEENNECVEVKENG